MDQVELLRQWSAVTIENAALKAEVASLNRQNESLQIRLDAAIDKAALIESFRAAETLGRREAVAAMNACNEELKKATKFGEMCKNQWHSVAYTNEKLREELMRRGADDPRKPKPPCDTAFAALQVVCKWDRDECVADLRKQRGERLRRIDALRSGRELQMSDVMDAMNKDYGCAMDDCFHDSLHYVLRELREQLFTIFDALKPDTEHEEWFKYPLSVFRRDVTIDDSDMEDDEVMESE